MTSSNVQYLRFKSIPYEGNASSFEISLLRMGYTVKLCVEKPKFYSLELFQWYKAYDHIFVDNYLIECLLVSVGK